MSKVVPPSSKSDPVTQEEIVVAMRGLINKGDRKFLETDVREIDLRWPVADLHCICILLAIREARLDVIVDCGLAPSAHKLFELPFEKFPGQVTKEVRALSPKNEI